MALIERKCPVCGLDKPNKVITLHQDDFTLNNSSYNVSEIPKLGLNPNNEYIIVECASCHLTYSSTHLDPSSEEHLYNKVINSSISKNKIMTWGRRTGDLKRWSQLLSVAGKNGCIPISAKLFDYGCGWGTLLQVASGPGITAIGFDVTPWKIEYARSQGLTVCTTEEEVQKYAPFDFVVSTSVLEHLHHPVEAVRFMASQLKPLGFAYITAIIGDVSRRKNWQIIKQRLDSGKKIPKEINPWEHLNYFTNETFLSLMVSNGFEPVDAPAVLDSKIGFRQMIKRELKQQFPILNNKNALSGFWRRAT
jgi:2-polyprenyl-3-methyl-5-hydroxy-6-metoxy-1,4-benzoquinol methylase